MAGYAQGYNKQDAPVRVNPGVLAAQAYGVKTSARDLLRFVEVNMDMTGDADIRRAVARTHVGYYQVGDMTQDLVWEQLAYPVTLDALLTANAGTLNSQSHPAMALNPRWRRSRRCGSTRPDRPTASAHMWRSCRPGKRAS